MELYQVLIVIDDHADNPAVHRKTGDGILDTLFIRGRHYCISTWVSTQKLRLMSSAVRVNTMFYCVFRLRNSWSWTLWSRVSVRLHGPMVEEAPAPPPTTEPEPAACSGPRARDASRPGRFSGAWVCFCFRADALFAWGLPSTGPRSLRRLQGLQRLPPLPPNPFRRHHSL